MVIEAPVSHATGGGNSRPSASVVQTPPRRLARFGRRVRGLAPTLVWLGALAAAALLYWWEGVAVAVTGYADEATCVIRHAEPDLVRDVYVALYEPVQAGQLLIVLDDEEAQVEADIRRLQAELEAQGLRWHVDAARTALDAQDITRQFAERREANRIDYLLQLVDDARNRVLLQSSQTEAQIVEELYGEGNASVRELNAIQAAADSLRVTVEENREVLAQRQQALDDAEQRWKAHVGTTPATDADAPILAPLRLAVDVRQRDLDNLLRRLAVHRIHAPFDGQVTQLAARGGDHVQPGIPLLTISARHTDRVVAFAGEADIHRIELGRPVTVLASASGERLSGTLSHLSPAVTQLPPRLWAGTVPAWGRGFVVTLDHGRRLMAGEAVQVRLTR